MDRLLLQQVVCALAKPSDSFEPSRVQNLFDRLLTVSKDSSSLGLVLWCSAKQSYCHQVTSYILNRLVESTERNIEKWNLPSIVNYVHSAECITPLHLAASLVNCELVQRLVELGADVWRPSTHGQVAVHFALKHARINSCSAKVFPTVQFLLLQMKLICPDQGKITESFRKFAILPSVIETNNLPILKIIVEHCQIELDYTMYLENLEYALQLMAQDEVMDYLLEQMKKCVIERKGQLREASPVDLSLQYSNLHAMLRSIQLGFHCNPDSLFDNGFPLLRRTLISERQIEIFPIASQCFYYLLRQMTQSFSDFSKPQIITQLQQLVSYKFSFKVCHRLNEPEVVIKGNYLTFALLFHCGFMAKYLAQMPIPVQFEVENNLLRYYRFSRHDEMALKCLLEQNRLDFGFEQSKFMLYFQQNCHPLFDASIINRSDPDNDDKASSEYAQDKKRFHKFNKFLLQYHSEPKSLTLLARNVILKHYWWHSNSGNDQCDKCHQSNLQNINKIIARIHLVEQYLGKCMFHYIYPCLSLS